MWGKIQKGEGTKRQEISKGSKKLSVKHICSKKNSKEKQWFIAKWREQVPAR